MKTDVNWSRVLVLLAHELRSPSSVITGYTRMIREGRLDAAGRTQAIMQIERASTVVASVGRQASDLSKWMTFVTDTAPAEKVVPLDQMLTAAIARIETKSSIAFALQPSLERACIRIFERDALVSALSSVIGAMCREALGAPMRVNVSEGPDSETCEVVVGPAALEMSALEIARWENPSSLFELGGWGLSLVVGTAVISAHGGAVLTTDHHPGVLRVRLHLVTEEPNHD